MTEATRIDRIALGKAIGAALAQCGIRVTYAIAGPSELYDVASVLLKSPAMAAHDAEVRASVVPEEPEWEGTTPRGFGYTEIEVANYAGVQDRKFTVQQSSLATEHKVWIGLDDDRAHMNVEQATRVRDALNAFLASAWLPVEQED